MVASDDQSVPRSSGSLAECAITRLTAERSLMIEPRRPCENFFRFVSSGSSGGGGGGFGGRGSTTPRDHSSCGGAAGSVSGSHCLRLRAGPVRLDEEARERRLHLVDQESTSCSVEFVCRSYSARAPKPWTRSWMMVSTTSSDEEEK